MDIFKTSDFMPIWIVLGFTLLAIVVLVVLRIFLQRLFKKIKDKNKKTDEEDGIHR